MINELQIDKTQLKLYPGTFLSLLSETRIVSTNEKMLTELVHFYINGKKKTLDISKDIASKYLSCSIDWNQDIPFNKEYDDCEIYLKFFNEEIENDYLNLLKRFNAFCYKNIDIENKEKVKRLIREIFEILDNDNSIENNTKFYISKDGKSTSINKLRKLRDINIQSFLLGIFHFVINHRYNNSNGGDSYSALLMQKKNAYCKNKINHIGLDSNKKFKLHRLRKNKNETGQEANIEDEIIDDALPLDTKTIESNQTIENLESVIKKYREFQISDKSYIKILIDQHKEVKFNDIYIQNRITKFDPNFFTSGERALEHKYRYGYRDESSSKHPEPINDASSDTLKKISKYSLLIGTEGIGKTMYLRNLFLEDLNSNKKIPFLISLRTYGTAYTNFSIFEIIKNELTPFDSSISDNSLDDLLLKNNICLYFDGLDEITTNDGLIKSGFIAKLNHFMSAYPNVQIIISSRPDFEQNSYEGLSKYEQYTINNFCDEDAWNYINNICIQFPEVIKSIYAVHYPGREVSPPSKDSSNFSEFANNASIFDEIVNFVSSHEEFASNPQFLTILLYLYKECKNIDFYDKVSVYEKHFDTLYRNNITKNSIKNYPSHDETRKIIQELAYKLLGTPKYDMTKEDLYDTISSLKSVDFTKYNTHDIEIIICEDLAYLNCQHDKYNFIHNSFKEYFAAQYYVEQNPDVLIDIYDAKTDISDNIINAVFDFIKRINVNVLIEHYFMKYFKKKLGDKINDLSYTDFLNDFRNQICFYSGKISEDAIFDNFDFLINQDFDNYLRLIEERDVDYLFEDYNEDYFKLDNSVGINGKYNHYIELYFEVTKFDYSYDTEGTSTPEYIDVVPDWEAEQYEHDDYAVGSSCIFSNLSSIDKKYYPDLYNDLYENPDFPYRIEYNIFKKFLKKHL